MNEWLALGLGAAAGAAAGAGGTLRTIRRRRASAGLLVDALTAFFGVNCQQVPVVHRDFETVDLPDLYLAIQREAAARGSTWRTIGYSTMHENPLMGSGIKGLIAPGYNELQARVAAEQYQDVDIGLGERIACLESGLMLLDMPDRRVAVNLARSLYHQSLRLEVMTTDAAFAAELLEAIRRRALTESVFRGKVFTLECGADQFGRRGHGTVRFMMFPPIADDEVILPDETMQLLERNTVRFFEHAATLRRAGRSVKRGLLLHGPPGTGKSYTAMWLAQRLPGVTVIVLTGEQLGLVKPCCQMARALAPALILMEDVDLIAEQREQQRNVQVQMTLHQLLNEMDGLASDAEVLFLLTTNRPDILEPALAARPGRIDQAIAYPLPDAGCRERLFDLYGRGLNLALSDRAELIGRTEGASPAFIKELLRKGALVAAEAASTDGDDRLRVTDEHLRVALREMILGGGALSRGLLGFPESADG